MTYVAKFPRWKRGGTDNVFLFFDKKTDDVLSLRRLRLAVHFSIMFLIFK